MLFPKIHYLQVSLILESLTTKGLCFQGSLHRATVSILLLSDLVLLDNLSTIGNLLSVLGGQSSDEVLLNPGD